MGRVVRAEEDRLQRWAEKPFRASAKNDDNDDEARVPVSLCTLALPAKPKKISDFYFFCLSVEICRGKHPEGYEGLKEGREVGSVRGKEVLHHTALLAFVSASLGCLSAPSRPHRKDGRTFRGRGAQRDALWKKEEEKMKNLKSFARVGKRGGKRQWQLQRSQQKESCECSYLGPITRKRAREIHLEDDEPSCSYEQQPALFPRTPASPQSCHSSETTEHPEMSTNSDVSEVETVDMKMDTSSSRRRTRRTSLRSSKKQKTTEEEAQQRQRQRQRQRRRGTATATATATAASKVGSPSSSSPLDLIEGFLGRCESQARKKQKDLADKYNYDFEQDMPARGGKFEWTQVKS